MRKLGILFIFVFVVQFASAQTDSVYKANFSKNYFKSYLLDTRDLALSPLHWNKWEWGGAALFAGSLFTVMNHDMQIYNWFQENRTEERDQFSANFLEPWGSGVYSMSVMAMHYVYGLIFRNERSKRLAMLGVKTFLLTGAAVTIPKMLFNRMRPGNGDEPNPDRWMGPFAGNMYKSFPSGHTTSVFAMATIVSEEYKRTIWVPVVSYTIATFSGLSRINDNKHWMTDVMTGAIFGWAMGKLIYNANNWKLSLQPYSTAYHSGVGLSLKI